LTGTNRAVVRFSNQRCTAEQWIKEGKTATHWTRPSCHRFRANEVRLLLGVIAYNLGNLLRRLVLPLAIKNCSLTSFQQRLLKTGGRLIRHARYSTLQLAESYLTPTLFGRSSRASSGWRGIPRDRREQLRREGEGEGGDFPAAVEQGRRVAGVAVSVRPDERGQCHGYEGDEVGLMERAGARSATRDGCDDCSNLKSRCKMGPADLQLTQGAR
jgi:DDE family transposase